MLTKFAALTLTLAGIAQCQQNLSLRPDGTFKIAQFSNIFMDGQASNYAFTMLNIQNVIIDERPDLVVLTGNTVSPFIQEYQYFSLFQQAVSYF